MVKFAEILDSQAVPSWSTQYVSYNRLKRRLEKCVYLRDVLLQIQRVNHKTPTNANDDDSDDEKVVDVLASNTLSALEKIKKSHRIGRLSSVESKERLSALSLNNSQLPVSPEAGKKGRGGDRQPNSLTMTQNERQRNR